MDLEARETACLPSVAGCSTAQGMHACSAELPRPRLRSRRQVGGEDTGGPFPLTVLVRRAAGISFDFARGHLNPGRIPLGPIGRWHLPFGDYDLEILAWDNHGLITGSIAAPDEIDDVARERLPAGLVERLERFEHRPIVGRKDIEKVLR
jgi:hypothetical protein